MPAAAGEEHLAEANGLVETARYVGMTAGPIARRRARRGRAARDRAGCSTPLTFLAIALGAAALHARRHPVARRRGDRGRARDGLAVLTDDRVLRVTLTAGSRALCSSSR